MRNLILTGSPRRSVGTEPASQPPEQVLRRLDQMFRQPEREQVFSPPKQDLGQREEEPGAEWRSEVRVSAHELAVVKWQDTAGRSRAASARIIDRSKTGLGLLMASPPPIHATVAVSGGTSVRGSVQYCAKHDEGYKVGLLRLSS